MSRNDFTVRVGGDSASGGIITTGEVFARIAAYAGMEVYTTRTIPSEIKGGRVMFQARLAPTMVWSQAEEHRLVLSGNQALSIGAIAAGCRFFAGYPITPATDIMEFLAGEFPRLGGTLIQAENEIAAIGMAMGASYRRNTTRATASRR